MTRTWHKAIASLVDRNAIVRYSLRVETLPRSGQMFPQASWVPQKSFDTMYASPNIDAAKKFLEASGYSAS